MLIAYSSYFSNSNDTQITAENNDNDVQCENYRNTPEEKQFKNDIKLLFSQWTNEELLEVRKFLRILTAKTIYQFVYGTHIIFILFLKEIQKRIENRSLLKKNLDLDDQHWLEVGLQFWKIATEYTLSMWNQKLEE